MAAGRNEPNVHLVEELPNAQHWRGAELAVTILGNWQYYRAKIHRQASLPCTILRLCITVFSLLAIHWAAPACTISCAQGVRQAQSSTLKTRHSLACSLEKLDEITYEAQPLL